MLVEHRLDDWMPLYDPARSNWSDVWITRLFWLS